MLLRTIKAATAALFLLPVGATALTVSFDDPSQCHSHVAVVKGAGGATCDILGGALSPNGTPAIARDGQYTSYWTATFNRLRDFVSIDLGDYGQDRDSLYLKAFNIDGDEIAADYQNIGKNFQGLKTLWVEATDIKSVEFGSSGYKGRGGVYADNLTVSAVPVPASVLLLGTAFAGLGAVRRFKRT